MKLTKECDSLKDDATLYQKMVNNLIYLTQHTLDISFSISVVSHFMKDPQEGHLKVVKIIVHYIRGTSQLGIQYCNNIVNQLIGYTDLDWFGYNDYKKNAYVYVFQLGSKPIVSSCKK